MDAIVVFTSVLSVVGASSPTLSVLRMLRVLRPLRLLVRFDGLRIAVSLLLGALPKCIDVALVYVLFLIVFAILAVHFFHGAVRTKAGCCAPSSFGTTTLPSPLAGAVAAPALGPWQGGGACRSVRPTASGRVRMQPRHCDRYRQLRTKQPGQLHCGYLDASSACESTARWCSAPPQPRWRRARRPTVAHPCSLRQIHGIAPECLRPP